MTFFTKSILAVLTLFAVLSVFYTIPSEDKYRTAADEGTYYSYATAINKYGVGVLPEFGSLYVTNAAFRLQPTPLRLGHLMGTAAWLRVFPATYVSLARFSFVCFVLFLAVSFYFSRKHFGEDIAFVFTMLLSSSPLMMGMGRRALSEMHGNLWCGVVIWLLLDFLKYKGTLRYYLLLFAFVFSVFARESALILWPFLAGIFIVHKYLYKNELPLSYLAGIVFIPAVVIGTVYAVVFGGIAEAFSLFSAVFMLHGDVAAQTSKYALIYCQGPWFKYLIDFIILSPFTFLLCLGYVGYKLITREIDWPTMYFGAYFMWSFFVFAVMLHFKDVRFLINLDMVITLFAVLCMWVLLRQNKVENHMRLILAAAVVIFFVNYVNFTEIFCINDVYDPISYALLAVKKIVP